MESPMHGCCVGFLQHYKIYRIDSNIGIYATTIPAICVDYKLDVN